MNYSTPTRISMISTISSDRTFKDNSVISENSDNLFAQPNYSIPSIAKNHIFKSRPTLKPSMNPPVDSATGANQTIGSIRNSCFVGNPSSPWEEQQNKGNNAVRDGQNLPFLSLSINNSCRFSQNAAIDQFTEERRKSESSYIRRTNNQSFLKGNIDSLGDSIKLKEANNSSSNQLLEMIQRLTVRIASTEEEIGKLKEKSEKDKKSQFFEGDVKELKGKLLQLAKFNSKHFTEYSCRLEEQQKMVGQVRDKILSFNSSEYLKKVNILETKLHDLYEGFKIKADHNQKEITKGIDSLENKLKDYILTEVNNLQSKVNYSKKDQTDIFARIQKIQGDLKERIGYSISELQSSSKKSSNWKTIQNKQVVIIKSQPFRQKSKSKFCNSPRSWVYQTPTKQNLDTPIKQLNFDDQIQELVVKEQTYYIDMEGYLLDEDKHYLLNSQNQQILLSPSLIACLKEHAILRA